MRLAVDAREPVLERRTPYGRFSDGPDKPRPQVRKRPDFAIEVVKTGGGIDKLEVYRRLDVTEVWFWIRGAMQIHMLRDGAWEQVARSTFLPGLDLELLCACLDRPSTTAAIRAFRDALLAATR